MNRYRTYASRQPTMEQLQYRLNCDMELLKKHPEHKELLERRINRTKGYILCSVLGLPLDGKI